MTRQLGYRDRAALSVFLLLFLPSTISHGASFPCVRMVCKPEIRAKVGLVGFSKIVIVLNASLDKKYPSQINPIVNFTFNRNHISRPELIGLIWRHF
jgi:hypothetical protein